MRTRDDIVADLEFARSRSREARAQIDVIQLENELYEHDKQEHRIKKRDERSRSLLGLQQ